MIFWTQRKCNGFYLGGGNFLLYMMISSTELYISAVVPETLINFKAIVTVASDR